MRQRRRMRWEVGWRSALAYIHRNLVHSKISIFLRNAALNVIRAKVQKKCSLREISRAAEKIARAP